MSTLSFTKIETRGSKEYAYEITSYWDKEKGMPRQKKRYLGRVIDRKKKKYQKKVPQKAEKLIVDFGDSFLLEQFFEDNGLADLLKDVFCDYKELIRVLVYYRLCYPSAMRYLSLWYDGNFSSIKYPDIKVSSQRTSDFLRTLGTETLQRAFFAAYIPRFLENNKGIIIDATSLPNQIHMPLTAWGRSGEEIDKQIRFLLVVDKNSEEPLFFRHYAGNIVDVSTLKTTIDELKVYGIKETYIYLDAGYFSEDNINDLYTSRMSFLTRLPSIRVLYKELIKKYVDSLEKYENMVRYGKRGLFIKQTNVELFGKKAYAHIVLDPQRKGRETNKLVINVADEKEKSIDELEYMLKTRGIMILVSSFAMKKEEVVPAYYIRQTAEKMFGFSKDDLNMLPLRVHNEETLRGLLFLQFIALIAYTRLKKKIGKTYTVEETLLAMRNLKAKVYDKELLVSELTKQQKQICEKLGIIVPKNLGI